MESPRQSVRAGDAGIRNPLLSGAALAAVFAAELALFSWETSRHTAWIFPRWDDQVQYLSEAYTGFLQARDHGFAAGAAASLAHESPQGALHGFLALLLFQIAGPSRTAALAVNLLAFICLQGATFFAVRKLSRSAALAWASIGLLAALGLPWSGTSGSASDFRLDWMAACAYGVALAAAIRGRGFRSWRWAAAFGVAVAVVLAMRFLTAVYFGLLFAAMLAWIGMGPDRVPRSSRLLLAGTVAALCAGPAFWRSRHLIYTYYWIGHFAGPEHALRDAHMGPVAAVRWFATEFLYRQVGPAALLLGLAAWVALYMAVRADKVTSPLAGDGAGDENDAWVLALLFLAVPSTVLLFHPAKSAMPLSIGLPSLVWLVVLAWIRLSRAAPPRRIAAIGGATALAGFALFTGSQLRNPISAEEESQYRAVNALDDFLFFRAEEVGLSNPRVAVTWVVDSMRADSFQVVGFERHARSLNFVAMLPTGLFESPAAVVRGRLAESDFVCLVRRAPSHWPFDREMAAMLPETSRWCLANLQRDGSLETSDYSVDVYERPGLGHPEGGRGVALAAMLAAAKSGRPFERPEPPESPYFRTPAPVLWSKKIDLHYNLRAAYSPLTFSAIELPEALSLDPNTGEVTGHFRCPGDYTMRVLAKNARGSLLSAVNFHVVDPDWEAELLGPASCREGQTTEIKFSAFDRGGGLDFIDISDLTEGKVLARLTPPADEKQTWQGTYSASLKGSGPHTLVARFVRFNPNAKEQYTFIDREFSVQVSH